ncbi:ankyrin repeat domain-containing protein [Roseimicrobium sp. ORNL1]|uniref:ankyrin repeat domain-containing protein n=1 Tax=Roseimicrobium sp. ORNL1 TaxID=2711231 RepID=UPI0013E12BB4|nr:ankyrin repeat domain-containing protein [Roseimicrobium sp. ORNL1]QIF03664.1 ankyrin repeat domain-containing protein [Roseimicrobium sp. ORNL1]
MRLLACACFAVGTLVFSGCSTVLRPSLDAESESKLQQVSAAIWKHDTRQALAQLAGMPNAKVDTVYESSGQPSTLLHEACTTGNLEIVKVLLEKGANVNRAVNDRYPLAAAAAGNHTEIIVLLLDRGAKINQRDSHGISAMMYAHSNFHKEACELLRAHGGKM